MTSSNRAVACYSPGRGASRDTRYVADAADMARVIRGEKPTDFSYAHDLTVQETLLKACGLWLDD